MIDIADFCRARIAEERETAQAAADGYLLPNTDSGRWTYDRETLTVYAGHWGIASGKGSPDVWVPLNDVDGTHIAQQDPRATLARADALDAMVGEHGPADWSNGQRCIRCFAPRDEAEDWPCDVVKGIAAIWAWHEDYDEGWKP